VYWCFSDIDFASFYDFDIWFRNCTTNRTSVNRLKRNSVRIENLHVRNLYLFYLWTRSSLSIDNTKVDSR
jgi:hypothetical protein